MAVFAFILKSTFFNFFFHVTLCFFFSFIYFAEFAKNAGRFLQHCLFNNLKRFFCKKSKSRSAMTFKKIQGLTRNVYNTLVLLS